MPTMDGLETMKLVRELQPAIPIIAISGRPLMPDSNSEPDFLAMAAKLGSARRLPKPFKPAALLAAVADCLAPATNRSAPDSDDAARRLHTKRLPPADEAHIRAERPPARP